MTESKYIHQNIFPDNFICTAIYFFGNRKMLAWWLPITYIPYFIKCSLKRWTNMYMWPYIHMTTDKSQNPRIFEVGRDCWRSSGPTLLTQWDIPCSGPPRACCCRIKSRKLVNVSKEGHTSISPGNICVYNICLYLCLWYLSIFFYKIESGKNWDLWQQPIKIL